MDVETLLAHRTQWVREEVPIRVAMPHLDEVESEVYQALIEDRYAPMCGSSRSGCGSRWCGRR